MQSADPRAGARVPRRATHPSRALLYWACTGVGAVAFAGLGIANLSRATPIMTGLAGLGYPAYLATILGSWKILAAVALLCPGLGRAKEWAYAGMFFTLTGAALSHALNHDTASTVLPPVLLLAVVMTSCGLWRQKSPARRMPVSLTRGGEHDVGY